MNNYNGHEVLKREDLQAAGSIGFQYFSHVAYKLRYRRSNLTMLYNKRLWYAILCRFLCCAAFQMRSVFSFSCHVMVVKENIYCNALFVCAASHEPFSLFSRSIYTHSVPSTTNYSIITVASDRIDVSSKNKVSITRASV